MGQDTHSNPDSLPALPENDWMQREIPDFCFDKP
jgi:hypothetical protein